MKTQGEIEAAVCVGMNALNRITWAAGLRNTHAHLIDDLPVVRLKGVRTVAEQQLVAAFSADKGRGLLKQVRIHLVETARPTTETMIQEVTGVKVVSLHHDISTETGEEVLIFTLAQSPHCRESRKLHCELGFER